jgi:hypothetical protein
MFKNTRTVQCAAAIIAVCGVMGQANAEIELDGVRDGDNYNSNEIVSWYSGHQTENSIYGDFDNPLGTTKIRYGTDTRAGDASGIEYFFLFVQAPLHAKNMIWQDLDWKGTDYPIGNVDPNAGLTEDDVSSYRIHHETHHSPGDMKLDFGGATGSEKIIFVDSDGDGVFEADIDGNVDNLFGLIDSKDSADYLFDNGLATTALSLNRDRTMSYEFQFALDPTANNALLDLVRNGVEMHLSPERGLPVPAPASAAVLGLGGLSMLRRRR